MRLQLGVLVAWVLGAILGIAWCMSGLAVNLLHMVLGCVLLGFLNGQLASAVVPPKSKP